MGLKAQDLKQYWFVIRQLTGRELKRRYVRSYLGVAWSVLNPLLQMIIMSLVFSTMFRGSIELFPLYFLAGKLMWDMFDQVSTSVMSVLVDNRQLLLTVKVPKNVFVLSRCYTAFVNFLYSFAVFLIMLLFFRVRISPTMVLCVVCVPFCLMFSLGMGYILSILYVFFADIRHLYGVFLTILVYLSALFYPVGQVPAVLQAVIYNNPVYDYIAFMRDCMVYSTVPGAGLWIRIILWGVGMYVLGSLIFARFENDVMIHL